MWRSQVFGETESGLPILSYLAGSEGPEVLLLGGVHGDEIEGVALAQGLYSYLEKQKPTNYKLTLVPAFNLDGVLAKQRANRNGVDLNRNLPTKDWTIEVANPRYNPGKKAGSEKENQALISYIEKKQPRFIFSFHSFSNYMLNVNGDCRDVAEVLNQKTGYKIEESIGYPTPGCLGTYTGLEKNIPTITYELEHGKDIRFLNELHLPAVYEALVFLSQKYK